MKKTAQYTLVFLILNLSFLVVKAQPANDNLADAIQVTNLPFSDTVLFADGQVSTSEVDEDICRSNNGTWWYEFTPSITGDYIIKSEVIGSDARDDTDDIRLGIHTGTAYPLIEVFCFDEDNGDGFGEDEKITLMSGTTYFIQIAPRDASVILDATTSVIPFNTWTGAIDSDWANTGNWSLGSIPTGNSLVQISGSPSNQPIIDGVIEALASFIFLLDGNDLTIAVGSKLTIITDESDGINLNHPNSTLQIDGQLFISDAEDDGIDVSDGVLIVNAGSNSQIQNCGTGIELDNEATHIINGAMLLTNLGVDGIAIEDGSTLNIGTTAIINMDNIEFDPIYLDDALAVINIDGRLQLLLAENGINVKDGTMNVGATANISINDVSEDGIRVEAGTNSGNITISNVGGDGINTGENTFTNTASGIITIFNTEDRCLDVENNEGFNNSGTLIAYDCGTFVIEGGTFNNLNGGIVRADGEIESSAYIAAAGSILEPGQSPGCLEFDTGEDLSNSILRIEIEGTTPCAEYDQIELFDELILTDATLELSGSYIPQIGEQFVIIFNDEINDVATGPFAGLAEGATINFNNIKLIITYQGGNGNEVVLTANAALPVELLSFDGEKVKDGIQLNWETASEQNNQGFEIQRSENGKQLKTIAFVAGIGTSLELQNYQWIDENPITDTNYYRLKQLDFDGQYEYSQMLAIDFGILERNSLQIFPNPTTDILNIQLTDEESLESIVLFDIHSKVVWQTQAAVTQLSLADLPEGIYFLQLKTANHTYQKRLTKQ